MWVYDITYFPNWALSTLNQGLIFGSLLKCFPSYNGHDNRPQKTPFCHVKYSWLGISLSYPPHDSEVIYIMQ